MAPTPCNADEILDREFLALRAKLLEIAAALDRIDRGSGDAKTDDRLGQISTALQILQDDSASRAEAIQMIFSLPYRPNWRNVFDMESQS